MNNNFKKLPRRSLCEKCKTPSPLCSWKYDLTPVPGWDATPSDLRLKAGEIFHGFIVKACPLFDENTRTKEEIQAIAELTKKYKKVKYSSRR